MEPAPVAPVPAPAPRPPNPGLAAKVMYKNRLQEYVQKASLPLPLYQTVNEGYQHEPQFRSTVTVDGVTFRSNQTFLHRKEAEQDVAKVALEAMPRGIMTEAVPFLCENSVFYKSILHEYAVKMNLPAPQFTTSQVDGKPTKFISSLVFCGQTYTGGLGKSKKEAQQIAARSVIETILEEQSSSRTLMSQIVRSKERLHGAMAHQRSISGSPQQRTTALKMQAESSSGGIKRQFDVTNENLGRNHVEHAEARQTVNADKEQRVPREYVCSASSVKIETNSRDDVPDIRIKRTYEDEGTHRSKKVRNDGRMLPQT